MQFDDAGLTLPLLGAAGLLLLSRSASAAPRPQQPPAAAPPSGGGGPDLTTAASAVLQASQKLKPAVSALIASGGAAAATEDAAAAVGASMDAGLVGAETPLVEAGAAAAVPAGGAAVAGGGAAATTAGAGVVSTVLLPIAVVVAVPVIGALIGNAIGLNEGSISNFNPWLSPSQQPLFHETMVEIIAKQAAMYDIPTGRFLNPDGTVGVVKPPMTDKTGYVLAATGTNSRAMWTLWKRRREAAIRFNFDQSKVQWHTGNDANDGWIPVAPTPFVPTAGQPTLTAKSTIGLLSAIFAPKTAPPLQGFAGFADMQYTVKSGDTLVKIAMANGLCRYGSQGINPWADCMAAAQRIADANGLSDPNNIFAGQVLTLPGVPVSAQPQSDGSVVVTALQDQQFQSNLLRDWAIIIGLGYLAWRKLK